MSDNIYSWEFDDKKNRWTTWYTIALSIVLWLSIWWFFTKQYWMSFIILLISGLVYFVENNSSDNIKVEIKNSWIKIWSILYDFDMINAFQLIYDWKDPSLLRLHLNKKGLRFIDIKINNKISGDIKDILVNYTKEAPKTELSFSEKFIKLLKL